MARKKNGKRKRSPQELKAIRAYYAQKRQNEQKQKTPKVNDTSGGNIKTDIKTIKNKAEHISAPYPHFRYYLKSGHPTLIVGEQVNQKLVEEYRYRKVMHNDRDGRHLNEIVVPNPDKDDPDPMYIARRVRHDIKTNFENKPLPWKYPKNKQ